MKWMAECCCLHVAQAWVMNRPCKYPTFTETSELLESMNVKVEAVGGSQQRYKSLAGDLSEVAAVLVPDRPNQACLLRLKPYTSVVYTTQSDGSTS